MQIVYVEETLHVQFVTWKKKIKNENFKMKIQI